ncbi:diacylglycerol/lipid kinase family protein [Geosporobacter ferrireducens]|uniref:DAGKc domain-containing protein n=1 Tax=Geosporobacter ferrireducens TaxID=1424294 RepID=A0A1D8GHV9_9FIRM|nr:diacylglycerol kinase family protein [Geosporobacter ferrireducens]AOT70478.1 hypothetical protein Gferi_13365 [Geosporobacter ferrireducens]
MSILFIVNPVAGKGKSLEFAAYIENTLKEKGIDYAMKFTTLKGEAEHIAKEAADGTYEKIVAVGGDGTVYEVINGLAGGTAALGVIPSGTGNDFVKTMKISPKLESALETVLNGEITAIDCGKVNGRYFINVASIGLDAEIVKKTEEMKKYIPGPTAYMAGLFKTLFQYRLQDVEIVIDDWVYKGKITLVAVGNGKYYGGGMKVVPSAKIDDGYFTVCLIKPMSKFKMLRLLPTIFSGDHIQESEVIILKGKKIRVSSKDPMILNTDGDISGTTPAVLEIIENRTSVIVPNK